MNNKLTHLVVAGIGALAFAGCATDEPAATPDPVETSTETADLSAQILAVAAASASHQIRNFETGQCITAPKGQLNENLHTGQCNGSDFHQKWAFVQVSASQPDTFYLVNQQTQFCAEVNNGSSIAGERVDDFTCNGSTAEQWVQSFRVVNGVALQQFRHINTSLCLDTVSGPGSELMQWFCGPTNDAQTWLVL